MIVVLNALFVKVQFKQGSSDNVKKKIQLKVYLTCFFFSIFIIYYFSYENNLFSAKCLTAKCTYGPKGTRWKVYTTKCPYSELFSRRSVFTAKYFHGEISHSKMSQDEMSHSEKSKNLFQDNQCSFKEVTLGIEEFRN